MTNARAIEILKIEKECIIRNEIGCDRKCEKCNLVQTTDELIAMYDLVIKKMKSSEE